MQLSKRQAKISVLIVVARFCGGLFFCRASGVMAAFANAQRARTSAGQNLPAKPVRLKGGMYLEEAEPHLGSRAQPPPIRQDLRLQLPELT